MDSLVGFYARSGAGHDRGEVYVIVAQKEELVFLVDGRVRTLAKPKKKNRKHIQPILNGVDEELRRRILRGEQIRDHEIRCAVRKYSKQMEAM